MTRRPQPGHFSLCSAQVWGQTRSSHCHPPHKALKVLVRGGQGGAGSDHLIVSPAASLSDHQWPLDHLCGSSCPHSSGPLRCQPTYPSLLQGRARRSNPLIPVQAPTPWSSTGDLGRGRMMGWEEGPVPGGRQAQLSASPGSNNPLSQDMAQGWGGGGGSALVNRRASFMCFPTRAGGP